MAHKSSDQETQAAIKRKRKPGKRSATLPEHPEGRTSLAGHEERLDMFCKRALELKRKGFYLHEICEAIYDEFKLETMPGISTVADWLKKGNDSVKRDIANLQWALMIDQFNELDRLKRKWMAIATADELAIRRWQMKEGELQPQLDENAIKEQLDATNVLVKIMARQGKLLGLDLEKAISPTGDGPQTWQDLQLWIIAQLNETGSAPVTVADHVLELNAGI